MTHDPHAPAFAGTEHPHEEGLLDRNIIAQLRALDARRTGMLADVIATYRQTASESLESMAVALARGDVGTLRGLAHRIKGDSASLGALRVAECADRVEQGAASGDLDHLLLPLEALDQSLARTLGQLQRAATAAPRADAPQKEGSTGADNGQG